MAEPPQDPDPFTNAPTQVRRGSGQTGPRTDDADDRAEPKGQRASALDATLIRDRVRSIDLREGEEISGVTPEIEGRYHQANTELGRGGIGRVMIAFDTHLARDVAIKELLPASHPRHPDDTAGDLARFLREARITGQLEHPSIVPVYELGQRPNGSLYYAMKLVRGRTLRQAIDEARSFRARMALLRHFTDLANAIAYAHSRGVVHRDIKPENVMLGEFGETVVLDWGLAKVRDSTDPLRTTLQNELRKLKGTDAPETLVGEVVGTPAYMSPEQAEGAIDAVDERSDVWSLGAVLFEILTGKSPFKGKNVEFLLYQVITADLEPVRAAETDAPADLAAIAEKALSKKPEDRYPDAGALVEDVIAFQNGRQVAAYHYSAWDLVKKFAREYRAAAIATLLISLTVAGGIVATLAAYQRAVTEQARAEAAQADAVAARLLAETNERRAHDNLSVALAEKARLLTDTLDFGAAGVYAAASILNNPFTASSPFRHPDLDQRDPGKVAAARLGPRSALYEILVRRQLTLTASLPTDGRRACAFGVGAAGQQLLSSDAAGHYVMWDLIRRKQLSRLEGPKCPRQVVMSPSGQRALIITRDRTGLLMDLRTGATRPLAAGETTLRAVLFGPEGDDTLYLVGAKREVARVRTEDLEVLARAEVRAPRSARLDPTGTRLAIGTRWGVVEVLDATTLIRKRRFKDHQSTVWALGFSADGQELVFGGYEGYATIRSLRTGRRVANLPGDLPIYALAFAPGGRHILGTGFEQGHIWSVSRQIVLQTFRVYPRGVRHLAVRANGSEVLTSGFGPDVQVWRFDERPLAWEFAGHAPPTYGFAASADGRRIATSDGKGRIRLWNADSTELLWEKTEPTVWALAFMGDRLLSISSRGRVVEWSSADAQRILQPDLPERSDSHVGIAANDSVAVWTGAGAEIIVYDRQAEQVQARFTELAEQSSEVALSPDGRLLAAADAAGQLVVWGLNDRIVRWRMSKAHDGIISGLSFSPDNATLASAGRDGIIRLWRASDGERSGALEGHGDWINDVAFSDDGRWLLSGSDDGSARLWSVADRRPALSIKADSQVNAVGFVPGRQRMVVGRDERFVTLPMVVDALELPATTLLREAERGAGLTLDGFELIPSSGQKKAEPSPAKK